MPVNVMQNKTPSPFHYVSHFCRNLGLINTFHLLLDVKTLFTNRRLDVMKLHHHSLVIFSKKIAWNAIKYCISREPLGSNMIKTSVTFKGCESCFIWNKKRRRARLKGFQLQDQKGVKTTQTHTGPDLGAWGALGWSQFWCHIH